MALPRGLARFNRVVTNRVTRPFASFLPGFAVVVHVGRRSGRVYRTPVNAFRRDDGFVIVLTYSRHTDWVRNVLAAGACSLEHRRRIVELRQPELHEGAEAEALFPRPLRWFLRLISVDEAMTLRR